MSGDFRKYLETKQPSGQGTKKKMKDKIRIGIVGGAGYTGGELIRLLIDHPGSVINFVHSRSQPGKPVYTVHQDLLGETELHFTGDIVQDIDIIFLCVGAGE